MRKFLLVALLRKIFLFLKFLYFGSSNLILAVSREKKWCKDYIKSLEQQFGAELNDSVVRRAVESFGYFVPLASDAFTRLHGRKSNEGEKERLVLYFLYIYILDDFTDKEELSSQELQQIFYYSESYQPKRIEEQIFLHAHLKLKSYVRDKAHYQEVLSELFQAQEDSANQFNSVITNEELQRITFAKGSSSTFFCHFYLDLEASETEQKCWRQLGILFQLSDDLMDIWDDLQIGQDTLPTRIKDCKTFDIFFEQQMNIMKELIAQLPFSYKYKVHMMLSIISICAFAKTAIHQLYLIQGNQPELGDLRQQQRKALILDMAKFSNRVYFIKFTYDAVFNWSNYLKANQRR